MLDLGYLPCGVNDIGEGSGNSIYMARPQDLNRRDRESDTSSPRIAEPLAVYDAVLPVMASRFFGGRHGAAWRRAPLTSWLSSTSFCGLYE